MKNLKEEIKNNQKKHQKLKSKKIRQKDRILNPKLLYLLGIFNMEIVSCKLILFQIKKESYLR